MVKPKQSAVGGTSIIYKFLESSGGDGEFPGAEQDVRRSLGDCRASHQGLSTFTA